MTTIAPHLAVATMLAVRHLGSVRPMAAAKLAGRTLGGLALVAMLVTGAFLAAVASAARGLAAVLAQFVRLAATVTSALLMMFVAALAVLALLIHH